MESKVLRLVALLGSLLLLAGICAADPINVILGTSTTGEALFTYSAGTVTFGFTGNCGEGGDNCLSGYAYYDGSPAGTYNMWIVGGPPSLGTPTNNVYPINMNGATINFTATISTYYLDGTINLTQIVGGSQTPTFDGSLTISSTNIPGYYGVAEFDGTLNLDNNPSLEQVYSGKYSTTEGYLSSGQFVPQVPEPGSMMLFGTGALGLIAMLRRNLGI